MSDLTRPPAWYSPETTIWLPDELNSTNPFENVAHWGRGVAAKKAAYAQVIASGAAWLIREVNARAPFSEYSSRAPHLYPAERLAALAGQAEVEFDLMNRCGMQVPRTEWHIPMHQDRARLVARVAIIEGVPLTSLFDTRRQLEYETHLQNVRTYQRSHHPGERLLDRSPVQFMVGTPRIDPSAPDTLYYVDVEPKFQ